MRLPEEESGKFGEKDLRAIRRAGLLSFEKTCIFTFRNEQHYILLLSAEFSQQGLKDCLLMNHGLMCQ